MIRIVTFIALLYILLPARAPAQMEFSRSLGPEIGRAKPVFQYQTSPYSQETVEGQDKDFEVTRHNAFLSLPVLRIMSATGLNNMSPWP